MPSARIYRTRVHRSGFIHRHLKIYGLQGNRFETESCRIRLAVWDTRRKKITRQRRIYRRCQRVYQLWTIGRTRVSMAWIRIPCLGINLAPGHRSILQTGSGPFSLTRSNPMPWVRSEFLWLANRSQPTGSWPTRTTGKKYKGSGGAPISAQPGLTDGRCVRSLCGKIGD